MTEKQERIDVATDNVARGAALLDQKSPFWFDKINFSAFDIQNPRRCVLTQVFGDWHEGKIAVSLGFGRIQNHGFSGQVGLLDHEVTPIWQAAAERSKQSHTLRAYLLWEKAGRPEGCQDEFWFKASPLS